MSFFQDLVHESNAVKNGTFLKGAASLNVKTRQIGCTVIGDIILDIFVHANEINERFSYGGTSYCDLIKAGLREAGNVAVGLSLLGGKVAFVGKAGNDFFWGKFT